MLLVEIVGHNVIFQMYQYKELFLNAVKLHDTFDGKSGLIGTPRFSSPSHKCAQRANVKYLFSLTITLHY